jgi:hypothetical protein
MATTTTTCGRRRRRVHGACLMSSILRSKTGCAAAEMATRFTIDLAFGMRQHPTRNHPSHCHTTTLTGVSTTSLNLQSSLSLPSSSCTHREITSAGLHSIGRLLPYFAYLMQRRRILEIRRAHILHNFCRKLPAIDMQRYQT